MNLSPGLIDDARLLTEVLARVLDADLRLGALARDDAEWAGPAHSAYRFRLDELRRQSHFALAEVEAESTAARRSMAIHGL